MAHGSTKECHYKGFVEVGADDTMQFQADVRLTNRDFLEDVEALAGVESVLVGTTWDGRFRGLVRKNLRRLQAVGESELRLPNERTGRAVLPDDRDLAYLRGLGDAPF